MEKKQVDNRNQPKDGMLKEKTNQDFNNQKPNPKDPNQIKNHPIGDDHDAENKRREVADLEGNKTINADFGTPGKKDSKNRNGEMNQPISRQNNEMLDEEEEDISENSSNKDHENEKRESRPDLVHAGGRKENQDSKM